MESSNWEIPVARLPTIVTTQISGHLPFPVPLEPSAGSNGNLNSTDSLPTAEVLNAAAAALAEADISHVRPRLNVGHLSPQPGSLEHAILQCNQHAFAYAAKPLSSKRQAQQVQQQQQATQAAAASTKQARPLPAKEAKGPVAKRRKRAVATDEEFVSRSLNVQQIADDVAAVVSSFLEKADSLQAEHEDTEPEPDSSDSEDDQQQRQRSAAVAASSRAGAGVAKRISKPFLPLDMLRELQVRLSHGKQACVLNQLDEEQLRQLLKMLMTHVQLGDGKLLDESDTATGAAGKAIAVSLEAACCCLQLLAAPGLSNSLYLDELLTATIQTAKYQLQFNVLAFHHAQYRQLYRPSSVAPDDAQATAGKKRARTESTGRVPRVVNDVRAKLELLLSLLAQVVDRVLLEVELLLPLVRVALTCLQVDSLQLLQTEAVALTVAVFKAYPQQRVAVMDELLTTVIANITVAGSRGPVRLFEATDAEMRPLPIMMATALVMQMVEASVQLPAVDVEADSVKTAFQGALACSDLFWKGVFARLPAAKAAKSDGACDFKLVMEALLADLSSVQMLPEWPAASILLRRFLKVLYSDKGLKHADTAVKIASVEFTGQLTARLCAEAVAAEQTAEEVKTLLEAVESAADAAVLHEAAERRTEQVINWLLLDYLATAAHGSAANAEHSNSITAAARRFVCCRMLSDSIYVRRQLGQTEMAQDELSLLLVQHRQLQDSSEPLLGAGIANLQLSRGQHVSLMRWWVVHGPLGAGRGTLIKWLVEAGSRDSKDPNPATVRTKVFKCLGCVVESDSRVLALPEVSAAVRAALGDDSVAVREAALELLAKLIHSNPPLAGEYFDVLVEASHDAGVSVRKRAIRSLWDCCSCPGFNRATEAVVIVLQRALDPEESMRSLVTKFCGDMWFLENSSFAGLSDTPASSASSTTRTADIRARELADVALKAYEAGGKAIHVPLAQDYPLVVILKEALGTGSVGGAAAARELNAVRAGAEEVAQELLNMVVQQQDQEADDESASPPSSSGAFPYLLALHALCCADASLAAPEADPQRFVRCLAPYIASAGVQQGILTRTNSNVSGSNTPAEDNMRRNAEECLCLLSILEALMHHLGTVEQDTLQQMAQALFSLINKQKFLQLVAAGCQLVCTLAPLYPSITANISQLVTTCYNLAQSAVTAQSGAAAPSPAVLMHAPRVVYIMGQICRYGAAIVDAGAQADSSRRSCTECMELCVGLWQLPDAPGNPTLQRVKDAALQAIGMLVIGKPQLMLQPLRPQLPVEQQAAAAAAEPSRVSDRGSPDNSASAVSAADGSVGAGQQQQGGGQVSPRQGGPRCAAEVYHAALTSGSVSVKSRVLTNLVELLRSEEDALVSRQKEAEAAGTAKSLASTEPSKAKAPLARVNGAADAAADSSSSSIVQRVWNDILKLATGVSSVVTPPGLGTPGGVVAAAIGDASQMRRKALELIEVVLRGGLVAPWTAVPPLVAQLTDEAPDTRQAALKALRGAFERYDKDLVIGQLAPGAIEAYRLQRRLWDAKHPGQPMPKSPGAAALEGISAMYQQILSPTPNHRSKFLQHLLKPFIPACNLADSAAAAKADVHKLAFITFVAASLPYKKADEPLVLIHTINVYISRQAQEVSESLRRQLIRQGLGQKLGLDEQDELIESDAAVLAVATSDVAKSTSTEQQQQQQEPPRQHKNGKTRLQPLQLPLQQELLAPLKASLALSMLLVLKQYLMAAYSLVDERVAAFELKGERFRAEQKALISKGKVGDFGLSSIDLKSQADATGDLLVEQYKVFKGLLDTDAANYKEAAVLAGLEDLDSEEGHADGALAGATPAAGLTAKAAVSTGLVLYSMDNKKLARMKSSGKSTAGKAVRTARVRAKSTTGKKNGRGGSSRAKGRKRRRSSDTEDSDDADWGDGPVPTKELF